MGRPKKRRGSVASHGDSPVKHQESRVPPVNASDDWSDFSDLEFSDTKWPKRNKAGGTTDSSDKGEISAAHERQTEAAEEQPTLLETEKRGRHAEEDKLRQGVATDLIPDDGSSRHEISGGNEAAVSSTSEKDVEQIRTQGKHQAEELLDKSAERQNRRETTQRIPPKETVRRPKMETLVNEAWISGNASGITVKDVIPSHLHNRKFRLGLSRPKTGASHDNRN